jgi:thioredoxin 2
MSAPDTTEASFKVVCPHDGAINRVPLARLADGPRCGGCHELLFAAAPVELDDAGFDRHLNQGELPLLVDFWASWCAPCRMMAPAFTAAAKQLEPFVRLAKIDTEAVPAVAARYGIRSIPTLILFVRGREVARHSGAFTQPAQIARWATEQLQR